MPYQGGWGDWWEDTPEGPVQVPAPGSVQGPASVTQYSKDPNTGVETAPADWKNFGMADFGTFNKFNVYQDPSGTFWFDGSPRPDWTPEFVARATGNTAANNALVSQQNLASSTGPDMMGQALQIAVMGGMAAGFGAALAPILGGGAASVEGVGSAPGTLEAANAVGAAGGDALGAFIEGNAANWGIETAAGAAGAAAGATAPASGSTGTTQLAGGAASDTLSGPGLIESFTNNLKRAFDPFTLMKGAARNALAQAITNDGKVDWTKVGVGALLNGFGGALGQTASRAAGGGLIGSVVGGSVSGVSQAAILGGKNMLATAIASGAVSGIGSITRSWLDSNAQKIATTIFGDQATAEQTRDIRNAIDQGVAALSATVASGNRDPKSIFANALIGTAMGYEQSDIDKLWNDLTGTEKRSIEKLTATNEQMAAPTRSFGDMLAPPQLFKDIAGNAFSTPEAAQDSTRALQESMLAQGYSYPKDNALDQDSIPSPSDGLITSVIPESPPKDNALDQDPIPAPVQFPDNALDQDQIPAPQPVTPPADNALDQDPIPAQATTPPNNALDQDPIPPPPEETAPVVVEQPPVGTDTVIRSVIIPEDTAPPGPAIQPPPTDTTPPPDLTNRFGLSFSDIALGFNPIAGRTTEYWKTQRI